MAEIKLKEQGQVKCPYCGLEQDVAGELYGMNVGLCYVDEGGCDKYFAYDVSKKVTITPFKIDGQEGGEE